MELVIITNQENLLATHAVMHRHLNYVPLYSIGDRLYKDQLVVGYKINDEDLLFLELAGEDDGFEQELEHMAKATIWGIVEEG
jgi:hypothetical protein